MECGLCNKSYDVQVVVPRNLPCEHTFCQGCLLKLWKPHMFKITCPTCQAEHFFANEGEVRKLPRHSGILCAISMQKNSRPQTINQSR